MCSVSQLCDLMHLRCPFLRLKEAADCHGRGADGSDVKCCKAIAQPVQMLASNVIIASNPIKSRLKSFISMGKVAKVHTFFFF